MREWQLDMIPELLNHDHRYVRGLTPGCDSSLSRLPPFFSIYLSVPLSLSLSRCGRAHLIITRQHPIKLLLPVSCAFIDTNTHTKWIKKMKQTNYQLICISILIDALLSQNELIFHFFFFSYQKYTLSYNCFANVKNEIIKSCVSFKQLMHYKSVGSINFNAFHRHLCTMIMIIIDISMEVN